MERRLTITGKQHQTVLHLNYLQLNSIVSLRSNEASADNFHDSVDHTLAWRSAVYSIARKMPVGYQLLQKHDA